MLHLSSWMTTLPMMLIGMTGILLVIGFLVLVVIALNCLTRPSKRKNRISKPPGRICGFSRAAFFTGADGAAFAKFIPGRPAGWFGSTPWGHAVLLFKGAEKVVVTAKPLVLYTSVMGSPCSMRVQQRSNRAFTI